MSKRKRHDRHADNTLWMIAGIVCLLVVMVCCTGALLVWWNPATAQTGSVFDVHQESLCRGTRQPSSSTRAATWWAVKPFCLRQEHSSKTTETWVECLQDSHCGGTGRCVHHVCQQGDCETDAECPGSWVCSTDTQRCTPSNTPLHENESMYNAWRLQSLAEDVVAEGDPCSAHTGKRCTSGTVCMPTTHTCEKHDVSANVWVPQRGVPTILSMASDAVSSSGEARRFMLFSDSLELSSATTTTTPSAASNQVWLGFSVRFVQPHQGVLYVHWGAASREALPGGTFVYWHRLQVEEEMAAIQSLPEYVGTTLAQDSSLLLAHASPDGTVAVLRAYHPTSNRFVTLGKHYVHTTARHLSAGVDGPTHVLWLS